MDWFFTLVSWCLILPGCVFLLAGGAGLLRMPDLYTRLHAASMTDTGATILLVSGMGVQAIFIYGNWVAFAKLMLILAFALFTTPTASHALAKSALMGGLIPADHDGDPMFDSMEEVEKLADVIVVLLTFLIVCTIGIIYLRDLLAAVILLGIYSLTAAGIFVVMDAVDVAFTEAAVGAGISTILLLGCLSHTTHIQKPQRHNNFWAIIMVSLTGLLLIYGTLDMPRYGDPLSPAQTHPDLAQRFLNESASEVGMPNVVTSVLASYRGYDTLGETVVVFSAGIAVLTLLGRKRRKPLHVEDDEVEDDDDAAANAGNGSGSGQGLHS